MSTFDLTQKVKIVTPNASSDSQYGPYDSIGEALTATENLRELGRTVGIIENGGISEYWFKEGITDNDLIPKTIGSNGSGGFFKEITKDGDFTAEKIEGGADDGKYLFKIVGDETLEWTIGDDSFIYNLDSNDEWTFVADALGVGVERRIDAVSYGNDGEIHYWKGTETGQASYPNVPETHILKTFVTITEDGVVVEGGGGVTDGDKGDIVVSDTGQSWHVHKLLNVAQAGKDQIAKVLPNGTIEGEDVFELWVYDDTVTPYDLTDLQTNYPTSAGRAQGFEVRCRLLTPPTTYRKESENDSVWIKIEGSNVV